MIHSKEITQDRVQFHSNGLFNDEIIALEKLFDTEIINNSQKALDGKGFYFIVHDVENKHKDSLNHVIEKYRNGGWMIKVSRSWSALFVDIKMKKSL